LDVVGLLAAFPRAGRERPELRAQLRSYIAHPYLVFHRVDDAARKVTIVRVLHGRLEIDVDEFED
jgi:plasmid stabilization system protein ParE